MFEASFLKKMKTLIIFYVNLSFLCWVLIVLMKSIFGFRFWLQCLTLIHSLKQSVKLIKIKKVLQKTNITCHRRVHLADAVLVRCCLLAQFYFLTHPPPLIEAFGSLKGMYTHLTLYQIVRFEFLCVSSSSFTIVHQSLKVFYQRLHLSSSIYTLNMLMMNIFFLHPHLTYMELRIGFTNKRYDREDKNNFSLLQTPHQSRKHSRQPLPLFCKFIKSMRLSHLKMKGTLFIEMQTRIWNSIFEIPYHTISYLAVAPSKHNQFNCNCFA